MQDDTDSSLMTDAHSLLLQFFIAKRVDKDDAVRSKYSQIINHYRVEQEPDLEVFLSVINKNIRFLYLEIRRAFDEQTGELHWGLVNTRSDEDAQMATDYNQAEIDLLKRIIQSIFESGTGYIYVADALNLSKEVSSKMTMADAEDCIDQLVRDRWINRPRNDQLALGVRSFLELRSYIEDLYKEQLIECIFCSEIVVMGEDCPNPKCSTRAHFHCLRRWTDGKARGGTTIKCPSCTQDWHRSDRQKKK